MGMPVRLKHALSANKNRFGLRGLFAKLLPLILVPLLIAASCRLDNGLLWL